MRSYVQIHDDVNAEAEARGLLDRIETLKRTIESTSNIARFDWWLHPYCHENVGGQFRILIELHQRDDANLVVFRQLLSHEKYDQFCRLDKSGRQAIYDEQRTHPSEVERFITERQQSATPEQTGLTDNDYHFLSQPPELFPIMDSDIVLETKEWCETLQESWVRPLSHTLFHTLYDLVVQLQTTVETNDTLKPENKIQTLEATDVTIYFRYFPQWSTLLLIDALRTQHTRHTEQADRLYETYGIDYLGKDELKRHTQRLYPAWLFAGDHKIWWAVQESQKANLGLSPEQLSVLHSLQLSDSDQPRYPLFINGRAGSGKSTILQFLFADVLESYAKTHSVEQLDNPPLYITYTRPLLDQAYDTVCEISRRSSRHLQKQPLDKGQSPDIFPPEKIRNCFKTVRELMLELLPESLRPKYPPAERMNLSRFRAEWDEYRKPLPAEKNVRELRAGVVWHGIRTYIKGLRVDSPQAYSALPRNWKSLSEETFTTIFEQGWHWYEDLCKRKGMWDDQDLACELLRLGCDEIDLSRYPAIYCDEAQDFTSVELRLIQILSLYTPDNFTDHPDLLRNIPVAFSGDPFQTLNPTGFKWGAIMAMYYEYLIPRRGPSMAKKVELNYHELSTNYRSSREIIELSNTIQLLRCCLSREKHTNPQVARDLTQRSKPQLYVLDEQVMAQIRESEGLVIIVPCDEDGEHHFIERDTFLQALVHEDDNMKRRIMSPLRAKGLEWERVLVYKFGQSALDNCEKLCDFLLDPLQSIWVKMSDDELLVSEYFLNNLYVAITRPRSRLLLVDSQDAVSGFWEFANDRERLQRLINDGPSTRWKFSDLGGFAEGGAMPWNKERDTPEETAEQLKKQGISGDDLKCLEDAIYWYGIANDQDGQDECAARVCELKDQFSQAADMYRKLQDWCSVLRCRWALGEWDKMIQVQEVVSEEKTAQASTLLKSAGVLVAQQIVVKELRDVLDAIKTERSTLIEERLVRLGLEQFFPQLITLIKERYPLTDDSAVALLRQVESTLSALYISDKKVGLALAEVYAEAGEAQVALDIWKQHNPDRQPTPKQDPTWVVRASVDLMRPAQRLEALAESEDHEGVLAAWSQMISSDKTVDMDAAVAVVNLAKRDGRASAPFTALAGLDDTDRCVRIIGALGQGLDTGVKAELRVHCIFSLVSSLVAARDWQKLSVLCDQHGTLRDPVFALRRTWGWKRAHVLRIVTDLVARANVSETWDEQDRGDIRSLLVKRYFWQQRRGHSAKGGFPDLDVVLRWLVRVQILAALVESVCSVQESYSFYRDLESVLSSRKRVSRDEVQFARERLVACASRLPKKPAKWRDWCRDWDIDPDALSGSVVLPTLSEEYISDLYLGSRVGPAPAEDSMVVAPSEDSGINVPVSPPDPSPRLVTATSATMALVLQCGDRILDGECVQIKQRIVLRDRNTGDQVVCGPDSVQSVDDLTIKPQGVAPHSSWLIDEWGIRCRIERRADGTMIQFFSPEGVIAPGCVFPISSDGMKS